MLVFGEKIQVSFVWKYVPFLQNETFGLIFKHCDEEKTRGSSKKKLSAADHCNICLPPCYFFSFLVYIFMLAYRVVHREAQAKTRTLLTIQRGAGE